MQILLLITDFSFGQFAVSSNSQASNTGHLFTLLQFIETLASGNVLSDLALVEYLTT